MSGVSNEQLLDAAKAGDVSVLKEWKKQNDGVDINKVKTRDGWTPLHWACFNGNSECVEYLIESAKADVHCRDGYGHTPLYWACRNGHSECVEYLIESAKADVNCKTNNGRTPLHEACRFGHSECVEYLIESAKADVNCKTNNGWTPLHWACCNGHSECVEYLIESAKADVNCKTNNGWTPLHWACCNGHSECVEYLIESAKADVHCRDNKDNTPLHVACRFGRSECVKYLIESAKADVNCRDNEDNTPLHVACDFGHSECVEHLISAKADANRKNKNSNTPFQMINVQDQVNMIKSTISRLSHLRSQLQFHKHIATRTIAAPSKHGNPPVRTTPTISIDQDRRDAVRTEALADVTFLCGQGDAQQPIKANSTVLMITVPSIQSLIDSGIQHQRADDCADAVAAPTHTLIPLPNLQSKHVQHVLECIYAGEISFDDSVHDSGTDQPTHTLTGQDDLQQLILVSNEFGFWRLKLVLEAELARKHLTADTIIDALLFADEHNCVVLKDAAMRMAAQNIQTVFIHPDFTTLFQQPLLLREVQARCSGRTKNDGIDDHYSGMSMMELYKVVDEDEGSPQVDSYMDRGTLLDFVRSIKSSSATETNGATEKEE